MELLQLRYFLTVARTLNISHSAKHHMIPQPAMSKTISRLEQELGIRLFHRYKNKLSLTNEGKVFYQSVSVSLNEIDSAVQQLNQPDAPLCGELRILVRQHRGTIVDCIMAFKKQHPQVSFLIFYEQDTLDYSDFDLCVACEQPDDTFNSSICLITEKLKLVVPADHPVASNSKVRFQSLRDEEFAIISQGSNLWQQTALQCRQAGFEPRVSITCSDLYCLMKYISAGMAITLGPEIAWKDLGKDNVVFVPTEPELYRSTYVFWNSLRTPSRLSIAYRDFMVAYFQAQTVSVPTLPRLPNPADS